MYESARWYQHKDQDARNYDAAIANNITTSLFGMIPCTPRILLGASKNIDFPLKLVKL